MENKRCDEKNVPLRSEHLAEVPSSSLQSFVSSRTRSHPVICDVIRLEVIRERSSVYSEDGEFIDLPLPPVPPLSTILKDEVAVDEEENHIKGNEKSYELDAHIKSSVNNFVGDSEARCDVDVIDISISPYDCNHNIASDLTPKNKMHLRVMEEDAKSIDSSTASNTLRKSSWSVTSIGSTGAEYSNDDCKSGCQSDSVDSDEGDRPEDDYCEHSSGYRDKSPFLRSISLSPVERRFRKLSSSRERRRHAHEAEGKLLGTCDGWRSQRSKPHRKHEAEDSTCCDDDFTWVYAHNHHEAPKASVESDRRSVSQTTATRSVPRDQQPSREMSIQKTDQCQSTANTIGIGEAVPCGKPPRPSRETGSLDRRRNLRSSRHERDGKSHSTHSLKENSSSSEFHKHDSMSSNLSLNSKDHLQDSGSFHNYNISGSGNPHQRHGYPPHPQNACTSPSMWEPPPPPPLSPWDPQYYWNNPHCRHQSKEELRLIDYHRRQQELYQYGNRSGQSSMQDLSCASGCCNRNYYHHPPLPVCCPLDHRTQWINDVQRHDTDERLRRLQKDKESLALQVKTLTEHMQTQSTKISELENMIKEKNQLLSNAEDLLQREMLSRSSLETQKLELMSAMSELKLQQAALERENLELRTTFVTNSVASSGLFNGNLANGSGSGSAITNVLNNNSITSSLLRRPQIITNTRMVGMSASTPGASMISSPIHHGSHGSLQQAAISPITPKTPPASYRQRIDVHYSSLPRQAFATTLSTVSTSSGSSTATDSNANPKRNVAFADAENRDNGILEHGEGGVQPTRSFTPQPSPSPSMSHKLKNIFGKIKRSNSGTLDDITTPEGEFKRGGVRATAGARLGWSGTTPYRKPDKPFREWDVDTICHWFEHLGLNMYEEDLRKWIKSSTTPGSELMKASPVDIEKELSLRNPLHRKKIVLAIADISGTVGDDGLFENAGKLDSSWVQRWLDDVGLPQYKEPFMAARMDGRMLHKLTMDDLGHLQISSCLHVASIRRGIQLMRNEKWNPDCHIRRPLQLGLNSKDDVRLWTSQRVHEWLRAVDLAEYAPNLRGSGVHGALMIFEVKFTAELFADLLNIPSSKTLLRRHLATHFKELLGRDIIQVKREAENTLGFQPLTITAKIKTPKKSQFSLKRKKSNKGGNLGGDEWSDYVCPMGGSGQEYLPPASSSAYDRTSTNQGSNTPISALSAFTSNASSPNTNIVTSIAMTKDPSTAPIAYPDSTTSSISSTTTSGVGLELASVQRQPSSSAQLVTTPIVNNNGIECRGEGGGSDSPLSIRSSTASTS
uniref:SAM domain-containing protein n=2 Tax=Anopheles quadriannulatus TaxID=34691 RepID=A0A904A620_ANOQN